MPKPVKNLWEQFISWDNLLLAAKNCEKGKRWRGDALFYNAKLEENLMQLQERLISGQWHPGPHYEFEVFEPKRRLIHAPCYRDRVLHHALSQVISPYFERRFMDQSFACRIGKGTHAASNYLSHLLRSAQNNFEKVYALKADISKYFYSIDHEILLEILARVIGDKKILEILRRLVTECPCIEGNVGLPLGALTSQLMANAYLDQLDHFIKDKLGIKYYVRYMDDFVVLDGDKARLWGWLDRIRVFLELRLRLRLNHKTKIFPISQGVDFSGYRHWPSHKLPRKRNLKSAKKRFKSLTVKFHEGSVSYEKVKCCVASFVGYIKPCKGWRSSGSALDELVLRRPESKE